MKYSHLIIFQTHSFFFNMQMSKTCWGCQTQVRLKFLLHDICIQRRHMANKYLLLAKKEIWQGQSVIQWVTWYANLHVFTKFASSVSLIQKCKYSLEEIKVFSWKRNLEDEKEEILGSILHSFLCKGTDEDVLKV